MQLLGYLLLTFNDQGMKPETNINLNYLKGLQDILIWHKKRENCLNILDVLQYSRLTLCLFDILKKSDGNKNLPYFTIKSSRKLSRIVT